MKIKIMICLLSVGLIFVACSSAPAEQEVYVCLLEDEIYNEHKTTPNEQITPLYDDALEIILPFAVYINTFEISPEGWQVAGDFLAQMPTLFLYCYERFANEGIWMRFPITGNLDRWPGGSLELEEGQFYIGSQRVDGVRHSIITNEVPDFFFRYDWCEDERRATEYHGFFDRYGNRITGVDVPWILGDWYATNYRIWDFGFDGFPVITVYYGGNWFEGGWHGAAGSIFIFSDGEYRSFSDISYRSLDYSAWSDFYFDCVGNVVRLDFHNMARLY